MSASSSLLRATMNQKSSVRANPSVCLTGADAGRGAVQFSRQRSEMGLDLRMLLQRFLSHDWSKNVGGEQLAIIAQHEKVECGNAPIGREHETDVDVGGLSQSAVDRARLHSDDVLRPELEAVDPLKGRQAIRAK